MRSLVQKYWFVALGLSASLSGCNPGCQNEVKREIRSPDGSKRLVIFSRDCGATTAFNTQVSVIGAAEPLPDTSGNVFIADDGDVRVEWKADGGVEIFHDEGLRVYRQEASIGGVAVAYRRRP